ncbi:hypothetical protein AB0L06_14680 [Spirillospora sp. NPDC052269]
MTPKLKIKLLVVALLTAVIAGALLATGSDEDPSPSAAPAAVGGVR